MSAPRLTKEINSFPFDLEEETVTLCVDEL